jgi:hypothetical protein
MQPRKIFLIFSLDKPITEEWIHFRSSNNTKSNERFTLFSLAVVSKFWKQQTHL